MPPTFTDYVTVILSRHSLKGTGESKHMLSPEGHTFAREVAREYLQSRGIEVMVTSDMLRTTQTLCAYIEGATIVITKPDGPLVMNVTGRSMEDWIGAFTEAGAETLEELKRLNPGFVQDAAENMEEAFRNIANMLRPGKTALVVSHDPCCRLAVEQLTGKKVDDFRECDMVALRYNLGTRTFSLEQEIRPERL